MRQFIAALLLLLALPSYAIEGFKPPDQLINPLVDGLLDEIQLLLDLKIPTERPLIFLTSKEEIVKSYCDTTDKCNVVAVTDNKTGIIYLDAMMEFNNVYNVSILYHELVHFVQIKNNMFSNLTDCKKWAASEMHAYKAQSDWLIYHNVRGFKVPDLSVQCK